jgi:SAM-dependent methyltransferase
VLDVGTGPGFYAMILAARGYPVTAVDFSEKMLAEARRNAGPLAERIDFRRMDAQALTFPDGSFDVIVTRNLTWNLQDPARAYGEWGRVLRSGGVLLNFDANWYAYLVDEDKRAAFERDRENTRLLQVEDHEAYAESRLMEDITRSLPMTARRRPDWDLDVLRALGCSRVAADRRAGERVWNEEEKINYASTPGFLIWATK